MMIRVRYSKQLEDLKKKVIGMGKLSIELVKNAVDSLVNKDRELAENVIKKAEEIDDLELEIEKTCMRLIALQQPVGKDLRIIGSIMRIIGDFDRVSDLAANIANITIKTLEKPYVKPLIDIPRMCEIAQTMIECTLKSFEALKVLKCIEELGKMDDEVDALFEQVYRELITLMIENPRIISDATYLLLVARYLERIADHACNIGGRIFYMVTGERRKIG